MEFSIEQDWNAWEEWNLTHGSIFQSKDFAEAIRYSGMGVELVVGKEKGKIQCGYVAVIPFPSGLRRYFSEYRVVNGPVTTNNEQLLPLLSVLETRAHHFHTMSIPVKFPQPNLMLVDNNGYVISPYAPTHSFHINLCKSEDVLWNELSQTTRTAIRKAQKNAVIIRQITSPEELSSVYSLYLARVKAKKKWVPYPFSFFDALWKKLYPNNMQIFVADYKGTMIAETIFFVYNRTLFYFNNGSLPEYWSLRANALLVWEGLLWGKKQGCCLFDFYGSSDGMDKNNPNYGLYVFKSGFGGKLIATSTFATKCLSPLRKKIWDTFLVPVALPIYKAWAGGGIDE